MTGSARNTPVAVHFGRLARRHSSVNNPKSKPNLCVECGTITAGRGERCPACARRAQHKTLLKGEEGFWEHVDRSGGSEACWEWTGYGHDGYGRVYRTTEHGVFRRSHRFAWYVTNGPIPEGMFVCHRCDNRKCCNPSHLFLGSAADNNSDRDRKGRTRVVRGLEHANAKLSDADVLEIRRLRASGVKSAVLAKQFGVRQATIAHIARGTYRASASIPNGGEEV